MCPSSPFSIPRSTPDSIPAIVVTCLSSLIPRSQARTFKKRSDDYDILLGPMTPVLDDQSGYTKKSSISPEYNWLPANPNMNKSYFSVMFPLVQVGHSIGSKV